MCYKCFKYSSFLNSLLESADCFFSQQTLLPVRNELLLLENVVPSCSDEVPGQRHPHNVSGDVLDGRGGVLLADLSWVEGVLQIPGSTKTFHYEDIISKTLF